MLDAVGDLVGCVPLGHPRLAPKAFDDLALGVPGVFLEDLGALEPAGSELMRRPGR